MRFLIAIAASALLVSSATAQCGGRCRTVQVLSAGDVLPAAGGVFVQPADRRVGGVSIFGPFGGAFTVGGQVFQPAPVFVPGAQVVQPGGQPFAAQPAAPQTFAPQAGAVLPPERFPNIRQDIRQGVRDQRGILPAGQQQPTLPVNQAVPPRTFAPQQEPVTANFRTACLTCHSANGQASFADFTRFPIDKADAVERIQSGSMPPGSRLSQATREALIAEINRL